MKKSSLLILLSYSIMLIACDSGSGITEPLIPDEPVVMDTLRIHTQFNATQFDNLQGFGTDRVEKIVKRSENVFLIGGNFDSYGSTQTSSYVEIDSLGNLIPISKDYPLFDDLIRDINITSQNKVVVVGDFENINDRIQSGVALLNESGSIDTSFASLVKDGIIHNVLIVEDQNMLISGSFTELDEIPYSRLAKLKPDGTLNTEFIISSGFNGPVNSMIKTSDGEILLTGDFSSYRSNLVNNIVKIDSKGKLNNVFNSNSQGTNESISGAKLDNKGRIIIWGTFTNYNGVNRNKIARINADGTLDSSFKPTGPTNGFIWDVDIAENGQIWVGGSFDGFHGQSAKGLIILDEDGDFSDIYYGQGFSSGQIRSILAVNNSEALIGGNFTTFDGQDAHKLVRLTFK